MNDQSIRGHLDLGGTGMDVTITAVRGSSYQWNASPGYGTMTLQASPSPITVQRMHLSEEERESRKLGM